MINSTDTYRDFADIYDAYAGKFSADLEFYKTYCSKSDSIVEIGCGTGRILEYLLNLDYPVTGVDNSQDMLDKATSKLKHWIDPGILRLLNHDFRKNSLDGKYNRALVTFYTFNYIHDKPVDFLKNIYKSLNDDGLLLMDMFYPNPLRDKSIDNKWIEKKLNIDNSQIIIKDNRSMKGNIEHRQQVFIIDNKEIRVDTERRYYSPAELKNYLEFSGFINIKFSPEYDLSGFSDMISVTILKNNYIVTARK